jgi:hypothetical protein
VFTIRTRPRWQSRAASPLPAGSRWQSRAVPPPLRLEVAVSCVPAREVAVLGRIWPKNRTKLPPRPQNRTELPPRRNKPGPKHARRLEVAVSCVPAREVAVSCSPDPRSGSLVRPRPRGGSFGTNLAQKPHGIATSTEKLHETATSAPEPHETATSAGKLLRIAAPPSPGNRRQDCAGASSEPASSSYSACSWASSDSVEDANLVERKAL